MEVIVREYVDNEGNNIIEYAYRGMRLRVYVNTDGEKLFNLKDIETLNGYSGDDIFNFLFRAMGDELFKYLMSQGNA